MEIGREEADEGKGIAEQTAEEPCQIFDAAANRHQFVRIILWHNAMSEVFDGPIEAVAHGRETREKENSAYSLNISSMPRISLRFYFAINR